PPPAAGQLVDDRMLVGDPDFAADRFGSARESARVFAALNGVLGDPVVLDRNDVNDDGGDIVLGRLESPRDKVFEAGDLAPFCRPKADLLINAVHVHAWRTRAHGASLAWRWARTLNVPSARVVADSTAMLDRDVIGFRPDGVRPIPLMPIALLSDSHGSNPGSWEHLVEDGRGPDEYRFDHASGTVQPGPDGLHEMSAAFRDDRPPENACLLKLGVTSWPQLLQQVHRGVTAEEMGGVPQGQLVLDANDRLAVAVFPYPVGASSNLQLLSEELQRIQDKGEARVWPLYGEIDAATGEAIVNGLVAARILHVEDQGSGRFELIVQPCMMSSESAVTDASRRRPDRPAGNPYICKIRIIE
ncbi:MAG TPA: hypothetical protein VMS17_18410, partial [Gemmataceae bacterium]|nr:hypothetical protein [Gemmataceae bacterium]